MRILYHHRVASRDGQFVHIDEIIAAFRDLGHHVRIVSPQISDDAQFGNSSGALKDFRNRAPRWFSELIELFYSLPAAAKLLYEVLVFKPDFIYERYNLLFISGALVRKLTGVPLILEVNSPLYEERSNTSGIALNRLCNWTQTFVWRSADKLLPVSGVLSEYVRSAGVRDDRICVLHNGANRLLLEFTPDEEHSPPILRSLRHKKVIGFTGFVRPWHGLDRVLRAIASDVDECWVMLLVGGGPDLERLQELANQLDISDRFFCTGYCERADIPHYIASFDVAVQSDVVSYASPLKLFEYMAMGRAILAPDRPNIREILPTSKFAQLFDPDSDADFFLKLTSLCKDVELRENLGLSARARIIEAPFLWAENAERIIALAER